MSIHFDSIKLPKTTTTAEGYLRGEVVVTRAGVFYYMDSDGGIHGELRHPDDLFKQESLETLKMIPITDDHPSEFVNAKNINKYQVGYTGERYDVAEDKIIISFTVTHQDAIDKILGGKMELSLGYETELKKESGKYKDERYDYRQQNHKYNHLAIVERGRAGSEARFRFDSAYEQVEPKVINNLNNNCSKVKGEKLMSEESQLRIDALTSEKEALAARLDKLQDELKSEKRDAKKSADDLAFTKSKLEDLQKKYDTEMETKADSIVEKKVMDRVELFLQAAPYLNDIETYSKHTDREIMEIAMNSVRTDRLDLSDESDAEVKGRFKQFVQDGGRGCPDAAGVLGVIKRDNDIASYGLSLHEQMAKQLKDDWYANRAKARGN